MNIRPATLADIPKLKEELGREPDKWEQIEFEKGIVFVAEEDGEIIGFINGRLIWQIEPLFIFSKYRKKKFRAIARKATYLLIKRLDGWIANRSENRTGIYSYFCFIKNRLMQGLAMNFGMFRIYTGGKFFGRDV